MIQIRKSRPREKQTLPKGQNARVPERNQILDFEVGLTILFEETQYINQFVFKEQSRHSLKDPKQQTNLEGTPGS